MCVQVIRDYQLMAVVCILVLVDVLVLAVWEFVDPLVIEVSNKTREIVVRPSFLGLSSVDSQQWRIQGRVDSVFPI